MRKKVRTLRHWKQRFNKNADFIWRRPIIWQGKNMEPGDPIPEALAKNSTKLRRFWESRVIELAEFEEPDVLTGQKPQASVVKEPEALEEANDEEEAEEPKAPSLVGRKPEDLVTKETDRKWHVEGVKEVFKSKTLAIAKAAAMITEAEAAESSEDDAWLDGDNQEG